MRRTRTLSRWWWEKSDKSRATKRSENIFKKKIAIIFAWGDRACYNNRRWTTNDDDGEEENGVEGYCAAKMTTSDEMVRRDIDAGMLAFDWMIYACEVRKLYSARTEFYELMNSILPECKSIIGAAGSLGRTDARFFSLLPMQMTKTSIDSHNCEAFEIMNAVCTTYQIIINNYRRAFV